MSHAALLLLQAIRNRLGSWHKMSEQNETEETGSFHLLFIILTVLFKATHKRDSIQSKAVFQGQGAQQRCVQKINTALQLSFI